VGRRLVGSTFGGIDIWWDRRLVGSTIGGIDVWWDRRSVGSTFSGTKIGGTTIGGMHVAHKSLLRQVTERINLHKMIKTYKITLTCVF
jgi:hypothetical protein